MKDKERLRTLAIQVAAMADSPDAIDEITLANLIAEMNLITSRISAEVLRHKKLAEIQDQLKAIMMGDFTEVPVISGGKVSWVNFPDVDTTNRDPSELELTQAILDELRELTGNLLDFAEKISDMTTYPAWNQNYDKDTQDRVEEAKYEVLKLYKHLTKNIIPYYEGYEIGLELK